MALRCMHDKILGFTIEYLALYPQTRCWIWDTNEEMDIVHVLIGSGKLKNFSCMEMQTIYECVVENSMVIEAFISFFKKCKSRCKMLAFFLYDKDINR
jgi:hypothetical protein